MYHFNESSGTHQRLMAQLGMAKSQAHADALQTHLRRSGNAHDSDPGENVGRQNANSSKDELLTRADTEAERKTALERQPAARSARSDAGNDEDDEEMIDGVPVSPCSLSKSLHAGAFSRLRLGLHSFMKAQSSDHTDDFATRYGMPAAHVAGRTAVVKTTPAISKSIQTAAANVAKTLGVSPMKSLNQKMATIAGNLGKQQLAKSISGGNTGGMRSAMPRYTAPQVEAAAGAALAHGAIDAQSAQMIANSLALGGVGAVPRELMAKLRGE
ncbi:hypothetical protein PQR21_14935 [Paraburkholderia nemoris]|uniref:hypothetical protein n=1 Tax=Paraburkholderia nemoris TaxID=2793076 RepID=UPI0038BDEB89